MSILFYTLHIAVCIFLILVVLLQQGKGADLSVFGGGATMTAFGARGAANVFHKLTVISFIVFMITTIGIGVVESGESGRSVVGDEAPAAAPATEAGEDEAPVAVPALPEEEPAADAATEPAAVEGGESGVDAGAADAGETGPVEAPDPASTAGGADDAG